MERKKKKNASGAMRTFHHHLHVIDQAIASRVNATVVQDPSKESLVYRAFATPNRSPFLPATSLHISLRELKP